MPNPRTAKGCTSPGKEGRPWGPERSPESGLVSLDPAREAVLGSLDQAANKAYLNLNHPLIPVIPVLPFPHHYWYSPHFKKSEIAVWTENKIQNK